MNTHFPSFTLLINCCLKNKKKDLVFKFKVQSNFPSVAEQEPIEAIDAAKCDD